MYDIIIIGAGPAGLSAAIYAIRAGHTVAVFEELIYGGQVANTPEVENYPAIEKISGADFSMNIYNHAVNLGAEIKFDKVTSVKLSAHVKIITAGTKEFQAKAVIIANGAKRRKLGCAGEDEFSARGVSYCATCDGAFYKGKDVLIVGGGNTALEDALFLANNCNKVHLVHRRDSFRGNKILIDAVLANDKIKIHYNSVVEKIYGTKTVEGAMLKDMEADEVIGISVSGVFVAVGLEPDNSLFEGEIELENGYIKADESCETNVSGVFVAGDTRTKKLRQIVTAASDGAIAAVEASSYISTTVIR